MISAIVLVPDARTDDVGHQQETAVRSLGWLVSAVVAGVVRDVALAAGPALDLADMAENVGCRLVTAEGEGARLVAAARLCRCERALVLRTGFQPIGNLVEEIDLTQCRGASGTAVILATPATLFQRLFPDRAEIAGFVTSTERVQASGGSGFRALAHSVKGTILHTRVQPIP